MFADAKRKLGRPPDVMPAWTGDMLTLGLEAAPAVGTVTAVTAEKTAVTSNIDEVVRRFMVALPDKVDSGFVVDDLYDLVLMATVPRLHHLPVKGPDPT